MEWIVGLIVFPLAAALLILVLPFRAVRNNIVRAASAVICAAVVYLLLTNLQTPTTYFEADSEFVNIAMLVIEFAIAVYLFILSIMKKKWLAAVLVFFQFGMVVFFEVLYGHTARASHNLFIDQFSIIMALIIGIIGTLICVYAIGYMRKYHEHHPEEKDRSGFFFFLLFVFLSAMFGVVFSNNLMWLLFFWEITTLCSFLLIGYSNTKEAVDNSFLALMMNLGGGLAFAVGIFILFAFKGVIELDKLLLEKGIFAMIPVALIAFAGLTKSAQLPFSKWLLGAMVAPTPTSALLHSSTMVKAGVYIVVRLSPILQNTWVGYMVAIVGGVTFLIGSLIAVSQRNAKKVLAYSTIANLGLIIACAGVGTYETVWAGVFLIIFHAVSKSLLFISVGTVENSIGSKDIESMDNLIVRMPKVTILLVIGICGMFIAPFGMLISKWAALEAFIKVNFIISPILIGLISYGSAATVFFWTKWLGKIIAINTRIPRNTTPCEKKVTGDEWASKFIHAVLVILLCTLFPFISYFMVEPYLNGIFGFSHIMQSGNLKIMSIMIALIIIIPLFLMLWQYRKKRVFSSPYMAGRNVRSNVKFEGSAGMERELALKNYYLENIFGESRVFNIGVVISIAVIVLMMGAVVL